MEGPSMVCSSRRIHNVSSDPRRCRKHFDIRKEYGKKKYVPSIWQIRRLIINKYLEYKTNNMGNLLLQAFIGGKPVKKFCF
jgi:hypothetical protein